MDTMTYTGTLVITSCWCGIRLAVPDDLHRYAKTNGSEIYCPLGHQFIYSDNVKAENEKLHARIASKNAHIDQLQAQVKHTEARRRATKAVLTKTRKRIHNGVCPHCTRHFTDLERHMKSQHPDANLDQNQED